MSSDTGSVTRSGPDSTTIRGKQARPSATAGIRALIPRLRLGSVEHYCGFLVHQLFTFPHDFSSGTLVLIFRQYCVNPHLQKWVPHRFKLRKWKLLVKKRY